MYIKLRKDSSKKYQPIGCAPVKLPKMSVYSLPEAGSVNGVNALDIIRQITKKRTLL